MSTSSSVGVLEAMSLASRTVRHVLSLGTGLEAQVLGLGLSDQVLGLDLGLEALVLGIGFDLGVSVMSAAVQLSS